MTKITVEQAVRAVQSATTAEEVQAVLEQCKKDQLHEVFLAVTGSKSELCPKSWKKADLVRQYTARTIAFKTREAFSAMDTEARAEYLVSGKFQQDGNTVDKLIWKLSPYELIALNATLGVSFEEYKDIREGYSAITSLKACIRHAARSSRSKNETKVPVTEVSKTESKAEAAFRQWKENFEGKDEFAFYATNDYLALLDVIAASKVVVSKEVDTYAAHWYIESGRSSREFRRVLLNTDPRKVVKFLNAAVSENTDNQVNAMRIAMGLATAESISWQERISQRRILKLIASIEAEHEVKPDYDTAFDETAYVPEVQEVSVIVDDIPSDHEPDVQEVNSTPVQEANATTYEAMREAYEAYLDAEDKYLTSRKTDIAEKAKSDEAFKQYLMLLGRYRQEGMSEREEALSWIREYCKTSVLPADKLMLNNNFDFLAELCHKCGIHSAFFRGYCNRHDMAVRLTREAGVETALKTSYEQYMEQRKELQGELHKLWQKRHALLKAQRIFGEGSADAEALRDVWDEYHDQADVLLGEYWGVCEALALKRESIRKYEADSQRADTLAMAEAVVSKELELQPAQIIKPKATISLKKKPHKISRKSHTPRWEQFPQLKSKTSRHDPTPKPLMKATRAALSVRIRKF